MQVISPLRLFQSFNYRPSGSFRYAPVVRSSEERGDGRDAKCGLNPKIPPLKGLDSLLVGIVMVYKCVLEATFGTYPKVWLLWLGAILGFVIFLCGVGGFLDWEDARQ